MTDDQGSDPIPKAVRGEALETESGDRVPAQQTVGDDNMEGSGEWPHPATPARSPAPGAVEQADAPPPDSGAAELIAQALAMAENGYETAAAVTELRKLADGERGQLEAARDACEADDDRARRAREYLEAALQVVT